MLALVSLLFLAGCGIQSEDGGFLEVRSVYPADRSTNVNPFGPYFIVFNQPLAYSLTDEVAATFPCHIYSSAETLFFDLTSEDIPYGRSEQISVSSKLTTANNGQEKVVVQSSFTIAKGENEPNGSFEESDTLRTGSLLDGTLRDGSPSDRDCFIICPTHAGDSVRILMKVLNDHTAYVVEPENGGRISLLTKQQTLSLRAMDTLRFYITNEVTGKALLPDGVWYQMSAN